MEHKNQSIALLVMDMQAGIVESIPDHKDLLTRVAKVIITAREKNIPVIYATVGFRQGAPEVSANNKGVAAVKERLAGLNMNEFTKVHPDLAPLESELTVLKRRLSAFSGSDLELILRALGIQHLVLTGVSTSGVVLSTLREATDKDYCLTVLADCCADGDEEVHRLLTTKVFTRHAEVLLANDWMNLQ